MNAILLHLRTTLHNLEPSAVQSNLRCKSSHSKSLTPSFERHCPDESYSCLWAWALITLFVVLKPPGGGGERAHCSGLGRRRGASVRTTRSKQRRREKSSSTRHRVQNPEAVTRERASEYRLNRALPECRAEIVFHLPSPLSHLRSEFCFAFKMRVLAISAENLYLEAL